MKVSFSTFSYNQRNDSALILCRTKEVMSDDNVFRVLSARSLSMLDSSAPSFQIELPQDINDLASPPAPFPACRHRSLRRPRSRPATSLLAQTRSAFCCPPSPASRHPPSLPLLPQAPSTPFCLSSPSSRVREPW